MTRDGLIARIADVLRRSRADDAEFLIASLETALDRLELLPGSYTLRVCGRFVPEVNLAGARARTSHLPKARS